MVTHLAPSSVTTWALTFAERSPRLLTVTAQEAVTCSPPSFVSTEVAVMVAVPPWMPVTTPCSSTVATLASLVDQVTWSW